MIRVVHPGSGIRSWFFTHPGSRGQKGTGSRIPDPDPQHCPYLTQKKKSCSLQNVPIPTRQQNFDHRHDDGKGIAWSRYHITATPMQCCRSASFWCLSGSGSDVPFCFRSKSGSELYLKFHTSVTNLETFFYSSAVYIIYLSHLHHRRHNFQYFWQYIINIKIFCKKYNLAVLFQVERVTIKAPDPANDADPTGSGCTTLPMCLLRRYLKFADYFSQLQYHSEGT